jgi:hypothetical protein
MKARVFSTRFKGPALAEVAPAYVKPALRLA